MEAAKEHNTEEQAREKKIKYQRNNAVQRANLIASGIQFINKFFQLLRTVPEPDEVSKKAMIKTYMEEVLHTIFFFGHIHVISVIPEEFLPDGTYERFRTIFPAPFEKFKTHLPTRTPYSILLEVVLKMNNPNNISKVLRQLMEINKSLQKPSSTDGKLRSSNDFALDSTVVSYSYFQDPISNKMSVKVLGASLACKGKVEREILIALSCIKTWNKAVAYAVHHARDGRGIKFPDSVYSEAFKSGQKNNGHYQSLAPCRKCVSMFHNITFIPCHKEEMNHRADWPYGNCAEAESLSKLLDTMPDVLANIHIVVNGTESPFTQGMVDFVASCQKTAAQKLKSRKFVITPDWQFFNCSMAA